MYVVVLVVVDIVHFCVIIIVIKAQLKMNSVVAHSDYGRHYNIIVVYIIQWNLESQGGPSALCVCVCVCGLPLC